MIRKFDGPERLFRGEKIFSQQTNIVSLILTQRYDHQCTTCSRIILATNVLRKMDWIRVANSSTMKEFFAELEKVQLASSKWWSLCLKCFQLEGWKCYGKKC